MSLEGGPSMSMVMSTSNLSAFSLFLKAFLIWFCALKPVSQPAVLVSFFWFSLASIWSKKAFYCLNTFSMWQVKDCQVLSSCLVEHETYVFSRVSLKCHLWMNFERTCDKILFPCSVLACNICTELNLFICSSFQDFSLNFEGDWRGHCPLGHFFKRQFQLQPRIGTMAWPGSNPVNISFTWWQMSGSIWNDNMLCKSKW